MGQRVRSRRVALGLTQEDLAELTGISRNQVQNIENNRNNVRDETGRRVGGTANPRLDTLWLLADALQVELGDLLSRAETR